MRDDKVWTRGRFIHVVKENGTFHADSIMASIFFSSPGGSYFSSVTRVSLFFLSFCESPVDFSTRLFANNAPMFFVFPTYTTLAICAPAIFAPR